MATLYVGKLIIDEVVRLAQAGGAPGHAWATGWPAAGSAIWASCWPLEFGLAVLSDVLGRIVSLVDSLLSEQFTNATSVRLMEHAASLDLEDFEDSELQDRLDRARRQTMGRTTLMSQLFGQAQDVVTIASFGVGLLVYAPWLIALLILALVPAFLGEAHFNAQSYSLDYARTPERREIDYVRQTGASVETAKEVKIFGMSAFLIERYRALAGELYEAKRRLATRRAGWGGLLTAIGHRGLLRGLRLHRLADAARRVHDRRPHVPVRLVPAPAQPARGPADRLLPGGGPGALPRRPLLLLRDRAGDRLAQGPAALPVADARGLHLRGRGLPLSRAPSAGRCAT